MLSIGAFGRCEEDVSKRNEIILTLFSTVSGDSQLKESVFLCKNMKIATNLGKCFSGCSCCLYYHILSLIKFL